MKRRRFSKEFKAKVAFEAIKGQRTANELAQEFGVHVSQINRNVSMKMRHPFSEIRLPPDRSMAC